MKNSQIIIIVLFLLMAVTSIIALTTDNFLLMSKSQNVQGLVDLDMKANLGVIKMVRNVIMNGNILENNKEDAVVCDNQTGNCDEAKNLCQHVQKMRIALFCILALLVITMCLSQSKMIKSQLLCLLNVLLVLSVPVLLIVVIVYFTKIQLCMEKEETNVKIQSSMILACVAVLSGLILTVMLCGCVNLKKLKKEIN